MKKGDLLYFSGLFDPSLSGKIGIFDREIKKKGVTFWKVFPQDDLLDVDFIEQTPIHFITDQDKSTIFNIEYLKTQNKNKPLQKDICCDKYNSKFCPDCGKPIEEFLK